MTTGENRIHYAAPDLPFIDINYLGRAGYIGIPVFDTGAGFAMVDTGPAISLPALHDGLAHLGITLSEVSTVLLTHIHLDHAGAVGTLARENPKLRVFVHERGAPHLIDPTKLWESATRVFGDKMASIWGEFLSVPAERITALKGGETIEVGQRRFRVEYTPGHASHHVSYFDEQSGTAFVGDTAGLLLFGGRMALPVTPPPDINVESWLQSLDKIRSWAPKRLFMTHFGVPDDATKHMEVMSAMLQDWSERVRASLDRNGSDAERAEQFALSVVDQLGHPQGVDMQANINFAGLKDGWYGLARYWRKKTGKR